MPCNTVTRRDEVKAPRNTSASQVQPAKIPLRALPRERPVGIQQPSRAGHISRFALDEERRPGMLANVCFQHGARSRLVAVNVDEPPAGSPVLHHTEPRFAELNLLRRGPERGAREERATRHKDRDIVRAMQVFIIAAPRVCGSITAQYTRR